MTPFLVECSPWLPRASPSQELLPYRERPEHIPTCQHILEHSQVPLFKLMTPFRSRFDKRTTIIPSESLLTSLICQLTVLTSWQAPYALLLACDSLANLVTKHWGAFSTTDRVDIRESNTFVTSSHAEPQ